MNYQPSKLYEDMSHEDKTWLLDRKNNVNSPFYNFIGNDNAIEALTDIIYAGLTDTRACPGIGIAFYGQASTGKTTLGNIVASTLDIPFLSMIANRVKTSDALFTLIKNTFTSEHTDLLILGKSTSGKDLYCLPAIGIFLDEAHTAAAEVSDSLLNATEQSTRKLITKDAEIDCRNVWWMLGTTEKGKLDKPLASRFAPIFLKPYTQDEVALIVQRRTNWEINCCKLIALYGHIPRIALEFARMVSCSIERSGLFVEKASPDIVERHIEVVARRKGIGTDGIDEKQKAVLISLVKNKETGQSFRQLCEVAGVEKEEMDSYIMPPLIIKSFVRVANRHFPTDDAIKYVTSL